jgi:RNA polymerase sigma-70 factor (ECF subfamily)
MKEWLPPTSSPLSCYLATVPLSALLVRLREGDPEAFRTLFDTYLDRVMRFMRRHSRSHAEVEDLTQALFLRIWEKRQQIDPERPIDAFLFTVAHHLAIDHLRKLARSPATSALNPGDPAMTSEPGPEDITFHRQLEELYHRAIDSMPPRRRDVFTLSRQEGLTHQQIAHRLGISVRTVENHMAAALQSMREFFARQDMGTACGLLIFFLID